MKIKKLISVVLIFGISITTLVGCGGSKGESSNNSKMVLKLGFDEAFPPFGFKDDAGEFTGFDIDVAKEVAKVQNLDLKLIPINWDAKDAELESDNINCIWSGFTMTGRENKYTFSKSYIKNNIVFMVREDSGIKSIDDLKGKKVVLQKASTAVNALDERPDLKKEFLEVRELPDNVTAIQEVYTKNVDAVLLGDVIAKYWLRNNPNMNLEIVGEPIRNEEYAVGFKLGNVELAKTIDEGIKKVKENGTYDKIYKKYFK